MKSFFYWAFDPKTPEYIRILVIVLSVFAFCAWVVLFAIFESLTLLLAPFVWASFEVAKEYIKARGGK